MGNVTSSTYVVRANIVGKGYCRIQATEGRISEVICLGEERIDEPYCSAGFIDLQINGWHGVDFSSPELTPEAVAAVTQDLWHTGVTSFFPTLVTSSLEQLEHSLQIMEEARRRFPEFAASAAGYHLEGPYLSPGPSHGAHNPALMHQPSWDEFARLQAAANGNIAVITVAPELPGASEFIRRVSASGVLVSIGHTDGKPANILAAAAAGARMSTHLGNGCPQFIHRHQTPIWAQLIADELSTSMICDGFHLPPELVQAITRLKGTDKCILVTDAVHLTGLSPGDYQLGTIPVRLLADGRAVTAVDPSFMAGSTVSMDRAIQNYQSLGKIPLRAAIRAATSNPAMLLGEKWKVCAVVEPGQFANLATWRLQDGKPCVEEIYLHHTSRAVSFR